MGTECHICFETLTPESDPSSLDCGHVCCTGCIVPWVAEKKECPVCKAPGQVLRSVFLRLADDENPQKTVETLKEKAEAIKNQLEALSTPANNARDPRLLQDLLKNLRTVEGVVSGWASSGEVLEIARSVSKQLQEFNQRLKTRHDNLYNELQQARARQAQTVLRLQEVESQRVVAERNAALHLQTGQVHEQRYAQVVLMYDSARGKHQAELQSLQSGLGAECDRLEDIIQKKRSTIADLQTQLAQQKSEEARHLQHTVKTMQAEAKTKDKRILDLEAQLRRLNAQAEQRQRVALTPPAEASDSAARKKLSQDALRRHTVATGGSTAKAADPVLRQPSLAERLAARPAKMELDNAAYGDVRSFGLGRSVSDRDRKEAGPSDPKKRKSMGDPRPLPFPLDDDSPFALGPKRSRRI